MTPEERKEAFGLGLMASILAGLLIWFIQKQTSTSAVEWRKEEIEGRYMHGERDYCPVCGYVLTVGEGVQCAGVNCPDCGSRMRLDIGEQSILLSLT